MHQDHPQQQGAPARPARPPPAGPPTDRPSAASAPSQDFLDQSLGEIKLLQYLNESDPSDEQHVLRLVDFFYHKEHLFIVCELLRDNLYELYKYISKSDWTPYFTLPRVRSIAHQCLTALAYIHDLNLIHCDLKPENILIKSLSRCLVKVIDFGSSCFLRDPHSSYVQSRSYRAPEVVLGLPYSQKIDVWSLGCILCELITSKVLFNNKSVTTLLAGHISACGDFPSHMVAEGRHAHLYFNHPPPGGGAHRLYQRSESGSYSYLQPKRRSLQEMLGTDDALFLDFISQLLCLDPNKRWSARELLHHPWFTTTALPLPVAYKPDAPDAETMAEAPLAALAPPRAAAKAEPPEKQRDLGQMGNRYPSLFDLAGQAEPEGAAAGYEEEEDGDGSSPTPLFPACPSGAPSAAPTAAAGPGLAAAMAAASSTSAPTIFAAEAPSPPSEGLPTPTSLGRSLSSQLLWATEPRAAATPPPFQRPCTPNSASAAPEAAAPRPPPLSLTVPVAPPPAPPPSATLPASVAAAAAEPASPVDEQSSSFGRREPAGIAQTSLPPPPSSARAAACRPAALDLPTASQLPGPPHLRVAAAQSSPLATGLAGPFTGATISQQQPSPKADAERRARGSREWGEPSAAPLPTLAALASEGRDEKHGPSKKTPVQFRQEVSLSRLREEWQSELRQELVSADGSTPDDIGGSRLWKKRVGGVGSRGSTPQPWEGPADGSGPPSRGSLYGSREGSRSSSAQLLQQRAERGGEQRRESLGSLNEASPLSGGSSGGTPGSGGTAAAAPAADPNELQAPPPLHKPQARGRTKEDEST